MRIAFFVGFLVSACSVQTNLGPAVTCPQVTLDAQNGSCNLDATSQQCSDGSFYEIDCQDDATCSCIMNGQVGASVLASDQTSGFCASLDTTMFHDIGVKCGWNVNP